MKNKIWCFDYFKLVYHKDTKKCKYWHKNCSYNILNVIPCRNSQHLPGKVFSCFVLFVCLHGVFFFGGGGGGCVLLILINFINPLIRGVKNETRKLFQYNERTCTYI